MSLKSKEILPVPEETIHVAKAAFPEGSPIMRLRDELGTLYDDGLFADLFPTRGQPAEAPWCSVHRQIEKGRNRKGDEIKKVPTHFSPDARSGL